MLKPVIIVLLSVMMIVCVFLSSRVQAGTIYEYTDRDGSVVLTDSPPSGVKAKPIQTFDDMTEAEVEEMEKEKATKLEQYRTSEAKSKERDDKIRTAREEYEQAIKDEERYRANKNQAGNFAQQRRWIKELEEQNAKIEEMKKKLEELESAP